MLDVTTASSAQCQAWDRRVRELRRALAWPDGPVVARRHRSGASLAAAAPRDQLFTATEVNELAWLELVQRTGVAGTPHGPGFPSPFDPLLALPTLQRMAAQERAQHALATRLWAQAQERRLPVFEDDEMLSVGVGEGSATWALAGLPEQPDWTALWDAPTALVTGSNGKTTTVRLLAAMLAERRLIAGYNCTDGIFVGGECIERGDYAGPAGARRVLRDSRVQAAVLETARGGILRRGLAVQRADAAIVTNISADHFGEYGVHDLSDLADAKLVVAHALAGGGVLVLNADDAVLAGKAGGLSCALAWFAQDAAHPRLGAHREQGGSTCGMRAGHLWLHHRGVGHDLGNVAAMPLSVQGSAGYNIANLAGAALLAALLGVAADAIAAVCARFGGQRGDNPGRLEQWTIGGIRVLLDYAHNPEGLDGLLHVAGSLRGAGGRLGLLLGQAGNRDDLSIRALARAAAAHRPQRVVLKDAEGYLRGRAVGEVPAILREELLHAGLAESAVCTVLPEWQAAQELFAWARDGDVLVLPVHAFALRAALASWLDGLHAGRGSGRAAPA